MRHCSLLLLYRQIILTLIQWFKSFCKCKVTIGELYTHLCGQKTNYRKCAPPTMQSIKQLQTEWTLTLQ